uniref:CaM kinase like vesicle associated n=1 Tax=Chelydra serpentina TaxID=8475 RepID=A0A8C3RN40_CHESE
MPFGCVTLGDKKDYNQPSEVTDRYDLGQVIKTEEFCEIFRAKEKTTGKLYTCKKFLKRDGRKVRKAAKNEIIILKMVKHPNILQLVDVYVTRKEYFIFLELATGREVFDWILDQGYYSERDTSNVIRQVLEAVAYLHSLKIVHRNLKLENLVYYNRLKNSKIVISDFHLAKLENGLIKEPCGTPEYLAPEVVGRQRYGRPVDCWAIGVIMYILLSGNPPFYEEVEEDDYENHDKNLFRKILAGDYEFDPPYWDDISQAALLYRIPTPSSSHLCQSCFMGSQPHHCPTPASPVLQGPNPDLIPAHQSCSVGRRPTPSSSHPHLPCSVGPQPHPHPAPTSPVLQGLQPCPCPTPASPGLLDPNPVLILPLPVLFYGAPIPSSSRPALFHGVLTPSSSHPCQSCSMGTPSPSPPQPVPWGLSRECCPWSGGWCGRQGTAGWGLLQEGEELNKSCLSSLYEPGPWGEQGPAMVGACSLPCTDLSW